jgi:hypothetical protein
LYDILGIGQGTEEPVREIDQLTPLAHDRTQARIEPAVSWLGLGGHGVADLLGHICPYQSDETAHRTVRLARRLTSPRIVSSYYWDEHHPAAPTGTTREDPRRKETDHGTRERRDHLLQRHWQLARAGASRRRRRGEGRRTRATAQGRRTGPTGGDQRQPGLGPTPPGTADVIEAGPTTWPGPTRCCVRYPTRFGNPSSRLKAFIDTAGVLWRQGKLADKAYSAFTAGGTAHGGQESTLLALKAGRAA